MNCRFDTKIDFRRALNRKGLAIFEEPRISSMAGERTDQWYCEICLETPITNCCKLNGCTHVMCMECAAQVATRLGGARCPMCRAEFETVTHVDGGRVLNVATHTLYDRAANNTLVPYLQMSAQEMKIASRIVVDEAPGEGGRLGLDFYVPQFVYELETPGWVMLVSDADDGPVERMMTRRDWDITYCYDRNMYRQQVQDVEADVHSLFGPYDFQLFYMKAQVGKALMEMVHIGKYRLDPYPQHLEDAPNGAYRILRTEFPVHLLRRHGL